MTHTIRFDTTYTDSSGNRHNLQTAAENDKTKLLTHAIRFDTTYTNSSGNRHNLQTAAENDKTKLLTHAIRFDTTYIQKAAAIDATYKQQQKTTKTKLL